MRSSFLLGLILVAAGTLGLVYDKISFVEKEKKVDLGPIEIVQEKEHKVEIPQVAGILTIAAGMIVIIYGAKRSIL